jgi:hypothetical protein
MGLVVHPSRGSNTHPFGTAIEGVFNDARRRSESGHRGSRAVIKVVCAAPAPVVLHNLVILQTTSPIFDNGFALAVRATHRQIALYAYILAIIL